MIASQFWPMLLVEIGVSLVLMAAIYFATGWQPNVEVMVSVIAGYSFGAYSYRQRKP